MSRTHIAASQVFKSCHPDLEVETCDRSIGRSAPCCLHKTSNDEANEGIMSNTPQQPLEVTQNTQTGFV